MSTAVGPQRRPEQITRALDRLDLDCIKIKLMDPDEGEGWARDESDRAEILYKRFLYLSVVSRKTIVPTKTIDRFWHQHILDTRKYATDCEQVFGFFLDHFPYFGMRGEEDAANLKRCFEETKLAYKEEFGEDYDEGATNAARCDAGKCGPSCGGTHCRTKLADDEFNIKVNARPSFGTRD